MSVSRVLLLSKIKIQNANAISSPYTIGFPAITAWMGAVHYLQRRMIEAGHRGLRFNGVGVVCHDIHLFTHKEPGDFVSSIIGVGSPLDRNGQRAPFIEDARCTLTVSLAINVDGLAKDDEESVLEVLQQTLLGKTKMAGGDVLSIHSCEFFKISQNDAQDMKKLAKKCMPGHVLVDRSHLVRLGASDQQDSLDAIIDYLTVKNRSDLSEGGYVEWTKKRKAKGWIVPISVGFLGLDEVTPPGQTLNQRDSSVPHRFAEPIVTLGEFIAPFKMKSTTDFFWYQKHDDSTNLYLCHQNSTQQL